MMMMMMMMFLMLSQEKRDRTLVDVMVLLDCVANMMVVVCIVTAYPIKIFGTAWICAPLNFFRTFTYVLNRSVTILLLLFNVISHLFLRLIPLVVVIFRMMMVCHVDFCHKHGEKLIRDQLLR